MPTPPRIFMSHSHVDDEFGIRLVDDLRRVFTERDAVWYDSHGGLLGGAIWWGTIIKEITTRNIFIVVLSSDAVGSKWVEDEINLAWIEKNSRGMQIIPILHRACTIRPDLRTLQVIDFQASRDYDLAFDELLKAIGFSQPQAAHQPAIQPQKNLVAGFMPRIEAAFNKQDWSDVLRKTDYVLKHTIEDLPANFYLWQGIAYEKRGRAKEAQGAYEMALVLVDDQQQRLDILKNYADSLISQKRWDDLLPLAIEALELLPNDRIWFLIKETAQKWGKTRDEWVTEAYDLINLKRYEEGLAVCEQAIKLDPDYALAYLNKSWALINLKRYEEALVACDQVIKLDPNYALAYINKGSALNRLNRHEEALAACEQAIKLDPKDTRAYNNKGSALYGLAQYKEALLDYNRAIQLDPNNANAHNNKGLALRNLGRNNEAQACFERAKQLGYSG